MPAGQLAFTTPATATPWQRWMVFSPMGRSFFFGALCFVLFKLVSVSVGVMGLVGPGVSPLSRAVGILAMELISSLVAYAVLVKAIERRPLRELALRDMATLGLAGLLAGALLISLVVFVLWLAGSYHVTSTNPDVDRSEEHTS